MSFSRLVAVLAAGTFLLGSGSAFAQTEKKASKEIASFGALRAPAQEAVRIQAQDWLKSTGKADQASLEGFNKVWEGDRPLTDKVADTFALGDAEAKKLLDDARDPMASAPTAVPALLKDAKRDNFFRSNMAVAYAKALSNRRVHEDALEVLKTTKPEVVVDPSTYLFHRAVSEHALLMKREAAESIVRLLDDVIDSPERYKMVAGLMLFDMIGWKEKDLGWIARKMDNIERRLDQARGGPTTQKMQKEVVARLDEIIKEMENQCKGCSQCNGGGCPNGSCPGGAPNNNTKASKPYDDSIAGTGKGPGQIDPKKLKETVDSWGKLPEKERAKAMLELTRDMPPRYREVIETYFKKLASQSGTDTAGK